MFSKKLGLIIAGLLLASLPALAQVPDGTIAGRIIDATGLPLPGVTVTIQGTDITRTFTSDGDGRYRFLELAPGDYRLTSSLQGFSTSVRERVIVDAGQAVDVQVTLAVGALSETVEVKASSPMVDI